MDSGEQFSVGYQCVTCGKKFDNSTDLLDHLGEWQRAPECPKRLITRNVQGGRAVDAARVIGSTASPLQKTMRARIPVSSPEEIILKM